MDLYAFYMDIEKRHFPTIHNQRLTLFLHFSTRMSSSSLYGHTICLSAEGVSCNNYDIDSLRRERCVWRQWWVTDFLPNYSNRKRNEPPINFITTKRDESKTDFNTC